MGAKLKIGIRRMNRRKQSGNIKEKKSKKKKQKHKVKIKNKQRSLGPGHH